MNEYSYSESMNSPYLTASKYSQVTIGQPAKRHLNGVLLAGQWWPTEEARADLLIGSFSLIETLPLSVYTTTNDFDERFKINDYVPYY